MLIDTELPCLELRVFLLGYSVYRGWVSLPIRPYDTLALMFHDYVVILSTSTA